MPCSGGVPTAEVGDEGIAATSGWLRSLGARASGQQRVCSRQKRARRLRSLGLGGDTRRKIGYNHSR